MVVFQRHNRKLIGPPQKCEVDKLGYTSFEFSRRDHPLNLALGPDVYHLPAGCFLGRNAYGVD